MNEYAYPQAHCRVGIARVDITPPVGIYHRMWGAATHDQATGVHQPLTAMALVLASLDGGDPTILLTLDHCLLWAPEIERILARLERETNLPRSAFALTFSHTHAAGLIDPSRGDMPGGELIEPYLQDMESKLVRACRDALANLQPAWIVFGTGQCKLAAHRDFWDEQTQQVVCGFNPGGDADDTLLVGRITKDDGSILGTIVNYACHPTTLAFLNTLISPDYPGAMREVIEASTNAPCIFLQGASGDLGPREGYVGDTRIAERNGRQLGYAVLSVLESLGPPARRFVYQGAVISGATLGTWDYEPLTSEQAIRARLHSWREVTIPLPYRPELPTLEQVKGDTEHWQRMEREAKDEAAYRDAHAMLERKRRLARNLSFLPPGPDFPMQVKLARIGDSLWVFVEGEHYQWLQRTLRERFAGVPVFVVTLTNGWRCSYLCTAETYGRGIYQETVAVLAKGCLERLVEAIASSLQ